MSRRLAAAALVLFAVMAFVPMGAAHIGEQELNETREIIASQTPCSELTDDQLAAIGDYYMEQMHPGEMHELMDQHMGGEGSESLRQAHIQMGERFYCGTFTSQHSGWMPMMPGMSGSWMGGMWGGMGWFGLIIWIGLLVLIVLGILYLVKQLRGDPGSGDQA